MSAVYPSTSFEFPKSARLLGSADFARVFESPEKSSDRFFLVLARPNGMAGARVGLAVSRKCSKRSTVRNRLKRLIRESFRRNRCGLAGLDLVVVGRPGAALADNPALLASLERHWYRIGNSLCARS